MDDEHFEFLRKAWAVPPEAIRTPTELEAVQAPRVRGLQHGVLRTVLSEMAGVSAIYGPVLILLFLADQRIRSFHLKALFICIIGCFRLMGNLIQAFRLSIEHDVLSLPILENLLRYIGEQERWIRFYGRFVPLTCAALAVFLLSDVRFRALSPEWIAGVLLYLVLMAVILRLLFVRHFNRRVVEIKRQFREWTGD
jgi:hypothetical protein